MYGGAARLRAPVQRRSRTVMANAVSRAPSQRANAQLREIVLSSMPYVGMRGTAPCAHFVSYSSEAPRKEALIRERFQIRERISNGNFFGAPHEQNVISRIVNIGPRTGGVAAELVAMWTIVPLDRTMQLPLNLAGGLRSTFAEVASSPLPERLAALVSRLNAERTASSGEGLNDGASTTKSSRLDRRGRC
jgi:hypothetical protein